MMTRVFQSLSTWGRGHPDDGMALLELAMSALVLFLIISGAVIAGERYREFHYAEQIVDRFIHEESVRPLQLVHLGTSSEIIVDYSRLESHRQEVLSSMTDELVVSQGEEDEMSDFSIEMGYVVLSIQKDTGELLGVTDLSCERYVGQGSTTAQSCLSLVTLLYARATDVAENNRSVFALPRVYRISSDAAETNEMKFMSHAVLLGLRVAWPIGDLSLPSVSIDVPQEASAFKIVALRGDVRL